MATPFLLFMPLSPSVQLLTKVDYRDLGRQPQAEPTRPQAQAGLDTVPMGFPGVPAAALLPDLS